MKIFGAVLPQLLKRRSTVLVVLAIVCARLSSAQQSAYENFLVAQSPNAQYNLAFPCIVEYMRGMDYAPIKSIKTFHKLAIEFESDSLKAMAHLAETWEMIYQGNDFSALEFLETKKSRFSMSESIAVKLWYLKTKNWIYAELEDDEHKRKLSLEIIDFVKTRNMPNEIRIAYYNISQDWIDAGMTDSALKYINELQEYEEKYTNTKSHLNIKRDLYARIAAYDSLEKYVLLCLRNENFMHPYEKASAYNQLAEKKLRYDKKPKVATELLQKALSIFNSNEISEEQRDSYLLLRDSYAALEDWPKAYHAMEAIRIMDDSTQTHAEQSLYRAYKEEQRTIEMAKKETQLTLDKSLEANHSRRTFKIFVGLVLLVLFGFFVGILLLKKQTNKKNLLADLAIEKRKHLQDIQNSLRYSERIASLIIKNDAEHPELKTTTTHGEINFEYQFKNKRGQLFFLAKLPQDRVLQSFWKIAIISVFQSIGEDCLRLGQLTHQKDWCAFQDKMSFERNNIPFAAFLWDANAQLLDFDKLFCSVGSLAHSKSILSYLIKGEGFAIEIQKVNRSGKIPSRKNKAIEEVYIHK